MPCIEEFLSLTHTKNTCMKKLLPSFRVLPLLVILLAPFVAVGQLPEFTFTVTATPQTCMGNGSLTFTVTGTNPAASMDYAVYLLPDTTTPVTIVTGTTVPSLVAGTYQVVATQSLGAESNSQTATATIANNGAPLDFGITPTLVRCGNDGVITVNVTSGTAATYQLTGPVNYPAQASNVFNNLPTGNYIVTVTDICGNVDNEGHTLTAINTTVIIDPVVIAPGELPSCNTIVVGHNFGTLSGYQIMYPLTFQYTVFPPGGGTPTIITQTVAAGTNTINTINVAIPFYHNQQYTYNLQVTDACGNTYNRNNNIVNRQLSIEVSTGVEECTELIFGIAPDYYVGPYTLNFVQAPAGFDPLAYNAGHPTYSSPDVSFGAVGNSVPEGDYSVELTDSCGRSLIYDFEVSLQDSNPQVTPLVDGCSDNGTITIEISQRDLVTVIITVAPDGFTEALPQNVSAFIANGVFEMPNLPLGEYEFEITDNCGVEYTVQGLLEVTAQGEPLSVAQRPGCEAGFGSVRLGETGTVLQTVTITSAPVSFTEPLPFDVSFNIAASGLFYMNSLPAGTYTFSSTDQCFTRTQDITINGYSTQINNIEVTEICGAFHLNLQHTSNGNATQSFYLQKYDPDTGNWGHPATGVPYPDNTTPTLTNSRLINNNFNNLNLDFTGEFRVLKVFYTYSNGSAGNNRCIEVLHTFTVEGAPVITGAYSFPCAGGLTEVAIIAEGIGPLIYSITTKNDEPFVVNNGTSNVFTGLEPATYNFRVTDDCNNVRNIEFNINELDPMEIEAAGTFCDGGESSLSVEQFSFLTYEWWEEDNPGVILSTESTLVFTAFDSGTDPGIYHVTISSNNPASCMNQDLTYTVNPNVFPNAGEDNTLSVCHDGELIDLGNYLEAPHDEGGTWADADGNITLDGSLLETDGLAEGTYHFRYTVTGNCDTSDEAIITLELKQRPQAPTAAAGTAAVCEGGSVQLTAEEVPGATYQWTGPDNFTSAEQNPLIAVAGMAAGGTYQVTVTLNGCASAPSQVSFAVNPVPVSVLEGNTLLCEGQSTVISVQPENFDTGSANYTWYYENELISGVDSYAIEASELGNYEVVIDLNGCTETHDITLTRNDAAFAVELEKGCNNSYQYVLTVTNISDLPGAEFEWTGPGGYSHTGPEAIITGLMAGEYSVMVTNAEGCSAAAVIVVDNTSCMIPKGISVNDDGLNDSFDLTNLGVRELKIFNRYGLEVYHKENYTNEWYGQSSRGELPTGTYYYVLRFAEGKSKTGWVYLQREIR